MTLAASRDVLRTSLRPLLDDQHAGDALAIYYAFHHPEARSQLFVRAAPGSGVEAAADGFLVRALTGLDLFRPLVTFRARSERTAVDLFEEGLPAGRPVYLTIPVSLAGWANKHLAVSEAELHHIYRLEARQQRQEINVLVLHSTGPDGTPRCEIRGAERVAAVAGVNWQGPRFAEIFVHTDPAARGRGLGRSVVTALAGRLLETGRRPLYVVAESNSASLGLAQSAGFVDTGLREYVGQATRLA